MANTRMLYAHSGDEEEMCGAMDFSFEYDDDDELQNHIPFS